MAYSQHWLSECDTNGKAFLTANDPAGFDLDSQVTVPDDHLFPEDLEYIQTLEAWNLQAGVVGKVQMLKVEGVGLAGVRIMLRVGQVGMLQPQPRSLEKTECIQN